MVKLFNAYFPTRMIALALSEGVLIVGALLMATFVVFRNDVDLVLTTEHGLIKIAFASLICMLCMYYYDLYNSSVLRNRAEELTRVAQGLGTACLLLGLFYYAYPGVQLGLVTFLTGVVLVGVTLAGTRQLFFTLNRSPRFAERAIILGGGSLAASVATEIEKRPDIGIRLVGYISEKQGVGLADLPWLGDSRELAESVLSAHVDRVIVAIRDRRGKLPVEDLLRLKSQGIAVLDGIDVYETITGKLPLDSLRLSWLLFSPGFIVSRGMLIRKRTFSILLSVLGLLVTLPLMALISLAIRLNSPGPVIFRQRRLGKDGKLFTLYKFRTMRDGADQGENFRPAQEDDERITRVGRWLRRTRLDELPQLYNILCGDMYFVGPRPFVPNQEEELVRQIPNYRQRWSVKPGATGWAQVHRGYCASLEDNLERLGYDLFYIKNMSFGLDLLILFGTVKILLLGRGGR